MRRDGEPSLLHLGSTVRRGTGLRDLQASSIGALRRYTAPQARGAARTYVRRGADQAFIGAMRVGFLSGYRGKGP